MVLLQLEGGDPAVLLDGLSAIEQLKARTLEDPLLRQRYVLSHAALHHLAAEGRPTPPRYHQSPAGKPSFTPGPHVSLSRAGAWAAVGLSGTQQIGVDIALRGRDAAARGAVTHPGLAMRMERLGTLGRGEAFLRAWTELEAIAKLRQIPLHHLLAGTPAVQMPWLVAWAGPELTLSIACDTSCAIQLFSATWDGGSLRVGAAPLAIIAGPAEAGLRSAD